MKNSIWGKLSFLKKPAWNSSSMLLFIFYYYYFLSSIAYNLIFAKSSLKYGYIPK